MTEVIEAGAVDSNPAALIPLIPNLPAALEAPADVVARATEQANVLMDIVESKHLYVDIQGKRFLTAEAWLTILAFNNVSPLEVETVAVKGKDGQTFGWKATVALVDEKTGIEVARASMIAGLDDFPSQGRTGTSAHRAAMSSAQTWAVSKAARIKYSWVAVLAGFSPTPADEMVDAPERGAQRPQGPAATPEYILKRGEVVDVPTGQNIKGSDDTSCPIHEGAIFRPPTDKQVTAGFTSAWHQSPDGFCNQEDLERGEADEERAW
jgi:hypothetical protein